MKNWEAAQEKVAIVGKGRKFLVNIGRLVWMNYYLNELLESDKITIKRSKFAGCPKHIGVYISLRSFQDMR